MKHDRMITYSGSHYGPEYCCFIDGKPISVPDLPYHDLEAAKRDLIEYYVAENYWKDGYYWFDPKDIKVRWNGTM